MLVLLHIATVSFVIAVEDAKQVVEAEERSYLYEIYEKRRKIAEKRNKTVEQVRTSFFAMEKLQHRTILL